MTLDEVVVVLAERFSWSWEVTRYMTIPQALIYLRAGGSVTPPGAKRAGPGRLVFDSPQAEQAWRRSKGLT